MALKTDTFRGPSWMASALVNGDQSGCDTRDAAAVAYVRSWLASFYRDPRVSVVSCEGGGFARGMSPLIPAPDEGVNDAMADIWLAGDTQIYTVLYNEKE